MMDRVAQLAEEAEKQIEFEKRGGVRAVTRHALYIKAKALGFEENEISAAIDTALKGR